MSRQLANFQRFILSHYSVKKRVMYTQKKMVLEWRHCNANTNLFQEQLQTLDECCAYNNGPWSTEQSDKQNISLPSFLIQF